MVTQDLLDQTRIIAAALPFIKRYHGKRVLAKIGGSALSDDKLLEAFAKDVSLLKMVGVDLTVVHGGGPQIGVRLREAGLPDRKKDGIRITDAAALAVVEEVLCETMNQRIVAAIEAAGGQASGLCGKDKQMLQANLKRDGGTDYGLVGSVVGVDLSSLGNLRAGNVPVIAPMGVGPEGETLNINADEAAAAIAVAWECEALLFLTDTDGIQDVAGQTMEQVDHETMERLMAEDVITGGMVPKVKHALAALAGGVSSIRILNGKTEHALLLELMTLKGAGTMITGPQDSGASKA